MQTNELAKILNGYFNWNKARMDCFVKMLISLIQVRTVNLAELVCGFTGKAKPLSKYQRMQRFFRQFRLDMSKLAYWVMSLFDLLEQPVYLSLDRTNWQWCIKALPYRFAGNCLIRKAIAIRMSE